MPPNIIMSDNNLPLIKIKRFLHHSSHQVSITQKNQKSNFKSILLLDNLFFSFSIMQDRIPKLAYILRNAGGVCHQRDVHSAETHLRQHDNKF